MPSLPRGGALRAAKFVFAIAVAVFIAIALRSQWSELREAAASARPRWGYIALSCALILVSYALLIEAWRVLLRGWGGPLGYWQSARIWTVSSLGRYLPGKVWALGSAAVMVQAQGVSGAAAVGAGLTMAVVNTLAGFIVLAATGAGVLELPPVAIVAIVLLGAATLMAPPFLPWLGRIVGRLARRDIAIPRIPHSAILIAAVISAFAWVLYGIAFRVLAAGVLSLAPGGIGLYTAIYTASYLAGFLAIIAPGGVGVREVVMAGALKGAGFGTGEAILLVVASRVWITVLEILPAALFLVARPLRRDGSKAAHDIARDAR